MSDRVDPWTIYYAEYVTFKFACVLVVKSLLFTVKTFNMIWHLIMYKLHCIFFCYYTFHQFCHSHIDEGSTNYCTGSN